MKSVTMLTTIVFSLVSPYLFAKDCVVYDTKITRIHQYTDGNIFVYFDKISDCSCQFPQRMAFHKNDDEKFFVSAALTALTTGKNVSLVGEDTNCPIHGNTAKMTNLSINAN